MEKGDSVLIRFNGGIAPPEEKKGIVKRTSEGHVFVQVGEHTLNFTKQENGVWRNVTDAYLVIPIPPVVFPEERSFPGDTQRPRLMSDSKVLASC